MSGLQIVVLGGDGFCGWPTSLFLSRCGHQVTIIDNFIRRHTDKELDSYSVVPIESLRNRIHTWKELTGRTISYKEFDVAKDYQGLVRLLKKIQPDVVVHFAEQRAAPYSMKSPKHKIYTVTNNVSATHNLLCAVVELGIDPHIIHLGTMGVYGYGTAGTTIPEGYIGCKLIDPVTEHEQSSEIYYPSNPGSIYHMTKVMDADMFAFYNKNDGVRITDLHQGIVWGVGTEDTLLDPALANRFDYDGDYGTVLNRFMVQSAIEHPLTVYGTGGQTRAFIHIKNMVECIKLAVDNPPQSGDRVQIWNQTTEQLTLSDLAGLISSVTGCSVRHYKNPRVEDSENDLSVCMNNIHKLGLHPIHVTVKALFEIYSTVRRYKDRINKDRIYCVSVWRDCMPVDKDGREYGA